MSHNISFIVKAAEYHPLFVIFLFRALYRVEAAEAGKSSVLFQNLVSLDPAWIFSGVAGSVAGREIAFSVGDCCSGKCILFGDFLFDIYWMNLIRTLAYSHV